jgi:hypothetical protein
MSLPNQPPSDQSPSNDLSSEQVGADLEAFIQSINIHLMKWARGSSDHPDHKAALARNERLREEVDRYRAILGRARPLPRATKRRLEDRAIFVARMREADRLLKLDSFLDDAALAAQLGNMPVRTFQAWRQRWREIQASNVS